MTRGVEKGAVEVWAMPAKANDCASILLLLLEPSQVLLAPLSSTGLDSTNVFFACGFIGTIRILVVTSAEVPIGHVLQRMCND